MARSPSIQFLLQILFVQRQPGWTSVDDTSDPFSMRFSKGGDAKGRSKRVGVSRRHRHLVGSVQTRMVSLSCWEQVDGSRRLFLACLVRFFTRSFIDAVVDPRAFHPFTFARLRFPSFCLTTSSACPSSRPFLHVHASIPLTSPRADVHDVHAVDGGGVAHVHRNSKP